MSVKVLNFPNLKGGEAIDARMHLVLKTRVIQEKQWYRMLSARFPCQKRVGEDNIAVQPSHVRPHLAPAKTKKA